MLKEKLSRPRCSLFRIRNNAQKTKEIDVKTMLFSLAYWTPIKLPFLYEYRWEREFFIKKKKKKKKIKISQKPFYSQVNDKEW